MEMRMGSKRWVGSSAICRQEEMKQISFVAKLYTSSVKGGRECYYLPIKSHSLA